MTDVYYKCTIIVVGGGGVLQHLEEEEEEAEPPEKPLIKNQQLLSSPNRKTSSNQHQMEPLSRKFTILSKIGEGGYGNVYTVKKTGEHEKDSNQIYALKVSAKPIGHHNSQKYLDHLLDEFFRPTGSRCRRILRIWLCSRAAQIFWEFLPQTPSLSLTQTMTPYQFLGPYDDPRALK